MAIIIQYVVEHNGVEKLVTTDKKAADQYDKMLEIADNLATYITAKGIKLDLSIAEELSVLLAKNKDAVAKLLKGTNAESVLADEKANVIDMEKRQA